MWTARTNAWSTVALAVLMALPLSAWSGAAAVAGQGTSEHFLGQAETRNNDGCPAPFHATPSCRTATPKTAERMLRHPVTLRSEVCPDPFDAATKCGVCDHPRELGEARWAHARDLVCVCSSPERHVDRRDCAVYGWPR